MNDYIKDAIDTKKERKKEEDYQKKTLEKQAGKLNKDIFVIQKQIAQEEYKKALLDKRIEKERLESNKIRQQKNQVHSRIDEQNKKNERDQDENNLKIGYYETIISQKKMFIEFEDERKERQKKIAEEAKNDTQDKEEVEKRRNLQLLMIYNQYLQQKMKEQLEKYSTLEETYRSICDICGTNDVKLLIDFITLRDKRYNFSVKCAKEKEKQIQDLKAKNIELKKKLTELKNNVITEEENADSKSVSTINTEKLEEEEQKLENQELSLRKQLFELGAKHNEVNLSYSKIVENIGEMLTYNAEHPFASYLDEQENDEKLKEDPNAPIKEENNEEQKDENEVPKQEENINIENTEEQKEENTPKAEEKLISEQEQELIRRYNKFLKLCSKELDVLFLMHTKQEFIEIMRKKGIEQLEENKRKGRKNKTSRRSTKLAKLFVKTEPNLDDNEEDDISVTDPDKKILLKFIKEQQKEVDDYINEKEIARKAAEKKANQAAQKK